MSESNENQGRSRRFFVAIIVLAAIAVFAVTGLLINIFERKQEARNPFFRVVELNDQIDDPAVWGKNFPLQYDDYRRTVDQQRTRVMAEAKRWSARLPKPTRAQSSRNRADRRRIPAAENHVGRLRFRERFSGRTRARFHARRSDLYRAPAGREAARDGCLHCHASIKVPFYTKLGDGDLMKGLREVQSDAVRRSAQVSHAIPSRASIVMSRPNDATAHLPARFYRRNPRAQSAARACRITT